MASQPRHDFVLQLRCDVVRDVQKRVLNASLLTHLAVTSPISRVLAQASPDFQMKAHWAKPNIEITEEMLALSAEVQGGVRYAVKGVNLTMKGEVNTNCRPEIVVDDRGQPIVKLVTPSPLDLHLRHLDLTYEGDDALLTWVDEAVERTLLRPTLCAQLMAPLANLPLNFMPESVPLCLTDESDHLTRNTEGLVFADAATSLDPHAESLMLSMCHARHTATPPPPPNLLPKNTMANAAVALSETSMNRILDWLCAQDLATGTTPQLNGPVSWRWTHVTVAFTDRAIHLTGQLWQGKTAGVVNAETICFLGPSAQLSVHMIRSDEQSAGHDVLIDAWTQLLRRIFYAASQPRKPTYPPTAAPNSDQPLLQRFVIPGTQQHTEASAVSLGLHHGYLVALYSIPLDKQPLSVTLEEKKPKPIIRQPDIPFQAAPGAPVSTQLSATLADSSESPYDYAWFADQEPHPRANHGPAMTVTKTPPPTMSTGNPHVLATVKLRVIDILGQVGEAEINVMYYPSARSQEQHLVDRDKASAQDLSHTHRTRQRIKRRGGLLAAGATVVLIAGILFGKQLLPEQLIGGPTLKGVGNIAPTTVNLSAEGVLDWAHWGYLESDNTKTDQFIGHPVGIDCLQTSHCINRKQGNPKISDFATLGQFDSSKLPFRLYVRDAFTNFSWNDGSPIASASTVRTQDYIAGVGNGYRIQVAAAQTTHTFRLYLGVWNGQVKCTASLSDGSAPDYVDSAIEPSSYNYVYTFTYRAASPGQVLTVDLTILQDYGGVNTSVSAATLQ